eukprot:1905840-Rhodomonas_salina.3
MIRVRGAARHWQWRRVWGPTALRLRESESREVSVAHCNLDSALTQAETFKLERGLGSLRLGACQ